MRITAVIAAFLFGLMACRADSSTSTIPTATTIRPAQEDNQNASSRETLPNNPIGQSDEIPLFLEITPSTINVDACARLRYRVADLGDVRLDDDSLPGDQPSGSIVVCPQSSRDYTLSGVDDTGRVVSQTVRLIVNSISADTEKVTGAIPVSTTLGCLFAVEALGTTSTDLCRYSPNGQRIAVPADDGGLWLISTDGDNVEQLVNPVGRFIIRGNVVWSPDGTYLAFSTVGLDGFGTGVGYYNFSNGSMRYIGPDTASGGRAGAKNPRWTTDGRLLITWYDMEQDSEGVISVFGPYAAAPDGPVVIPLNAELELDAGYVGQQTFPWQPGRQWQVGDEPSYEVD